MPLFPVLEIETLVQENDKTRFNALKSYAAGVADITTMTIKPTKLLTAINVFADQVLDWQYGFKIDIDAENNKLNFSEGGSELTATLATGEYTLAALATEIQTKMRAAGALLYVVSVSDVNAFTIEAPSEFELLPEGTNASTSILPEIGYAEDVAGDDSYEGEKVERITRKITLAIGNGTDNGSLTQEIEVVSELADKLFSTDDRLRKHESNILKYVPEGRATFKDVHRRAQTLILAWLDTHGFVDALGGKIGLSQITDTEDCAEWATMMALRLIFADLSNAIDDVFDKKSKYYKGEELFYRNRATLKVDLNRDGTADAVTERLDIRSARVVRR